MTGPSFSTELKYYLCHILKAHVYWDLVFGFLLFQSFCLFFCQFQLDLNALFSFSIFYSEGGQVPFLILLFFIRFLAISELYFSIWTLRLFYPIGIVMGIFVFICFLCFGRAVIFMISVFPFNTSYVLYLFKFYFIPSVRFYSSFIWSCVFPLN